MNAQSPGSDTAPALPARDDPIRIEFGGRSYSAAEGETILDTLLRHGVPLTHSCRKGSCHCCVLRLVSGEVDTTRGNDPATAHDAHVLPCISVPRGDVVLADAEPQHRPIRCEVIACTRLAPDIVAIDLAPHTTLAFEAGQHITLVRDDGVSRCYSIVSLPHEDFTFRIHVQRTPAGGMSVWLCDEVRPGQRLHLRGPHGNLGDLRTVARDDALLFLATGSGVGALFGVVRAALQCGHSGAITLYHGARDTPGLYLHDTLQALAASTPNLRYVPCLSEGEAIHGIEAGRITDVVAREHDDLAGQHVFLCGSPAMVAEARVWALRAGARRDRIHAETFAPAAPPIPRDTGKFAAFAAENALWHALDEGPRLSAILRDFYVLVYADAQLAPYFAGIPADWVIQKQYEFLAALFSGDRGYFGLHPFNAHHWMVISDALFDHREDLFERVLVEHALPRRLIGRWLALHELFRAEIVKPQPRGMFVGGSERPLHTHAVQRLDIDTVCDGCGEEIRAGVPSRYHYRIGTLHCSACAGLAHVGVTEQAGERSTSS